MTKRKTRSWPRAWKFFRRVAILSIGSEKCNTDGGKKRNPLSCASQMRASLGGPLQRLPRGKEQVVTNRAQAPLFRQRLRSLPRQNASLCEGKSLSPWRKE